MAGITLARRRIGPRRRPDLVRALWRLLTSIRFAVWLIVFVVLSGLIGILLPQIPTAMRGDAAAINAWLAFEHGKFGPFSGVLYRLGLFDVFETRWFQAGLGLLAVSVAVCVANRLPPIWRSIHRPQKRVAEGYLRRARHRAEFEAAIDPTSLERVLKRHHYRVERFAEGETTYLFADRFPWAQFGTFASHLALIVFMLAGLASVLTGYEVQLFIAKGQDAPVFAVQHPDQMQVHLDDTIGRFNSEGRPLDYRSFLTIYQGGREAKRCVTTVNDPCSFAGYRFSQAAYFGFGAELQVRDLNSGRTVFSEVLQLSQKMPAPHVVVRDDAGALLFDDTLIMRTFVEGGYLTRLSIPGTQRAFLVGVRRDDQTHQWVLVALEASAGADRLLLNQGQEGATGGLHFRFVGVSILPAATRGDVPVALPAASAAASPPAARAPVLVQMTNTVYGTGEASSGRSLAVPPGNGGAVTLYMTGLGNQVATLQQGQSIDVNGYEYSFLGRREFAGIQVKRDQGALLFWLSIALLVGGTAITFHVPRRRLWAKITPEQTCMASLAAHLVDFSRELRQLGAEAGTPAAVTSDEGIEAD